MSGAVRVTVPLLAALALWPGMALADDPAGPAGVAAAPWSRLDAASVTAWLPAGRWAVLVVTASAAHPEAGRAQAAVAAGLRGGGRTTLVIDDGALGDVSLLDEAHILARSSRLPVDLVAILRLEDDPSGPVLHGALYDRRTAALLGELAARPGSAPFISTPGGPSPDEDAPGKPVVPAPPPAPTPMAGAAPAPPMLPPGLVARLVVFGRPAPEDLEASVEAWDPMQGLMNGRRLRGAAFYEAIDRPDLAHEYRDRSSRQLKILVPGLCVAAAGLLLTQGALYISNDDGWKYMLGGAGVMVVGGAVALSSLAIHRSPVPGRRAVRMARDFNRRLEQQYGVQLDTGASEADELPPDALRAPTSAPGVRVVVGPAPLPSGGGLMVAGEF